MTTPIKQHPDQDAPLDSLRTYLQQLGVDTTNLTNDEIRQRVTLTVQGNTIIGMRYDLYEEPLDAEPPDEPRCDR